MDVVKPEGTKCRERWGLGSRDPGWEGCQSVLRSGGLKVRLAQGNCVGESQR